MDKPYHGDKVAAIGWDGDGDGDGTVIGYCAIGLVGDSGGTADTLALGASAARREGSTPSYHTLGANAQAGDAAVATARRIRP